MNRKKETQESKIEYYSLKEILKRKCQYNMVFGQRSNGKTYATLEHGIREFFEKGAEMAYIRRNIEDLRGKRGQTLFDNLVNNGVVEKYSNGVWSDVYYYGLRWYFCRYEEDARGNKSRVTDEKPFCWGFALSTMEHDKSSSYPKVQNIIFDEFLSRSGYLPEEFVLLMNVISTIARLRLDVTIFMIGNTVNRYCPYFKEMGLSNVKTQKQGTIDVYRYGDSDLKVAVEYAADITSKSGHKGTLFAFDNPKLQMVTKGSWEIDIYPHLPYKYKKDDIIYTFFIEYDGEMLQCEVIRRGVGADGKEVKATILYIHQKTTELKNPDRDVIFSPEIDPRPNHYTMITKMVDKRVKKISEFFKKDKVFYQNNEVGEIVNNYLEFCK